jgi:pilus assembly protein CpaE
MRVLDPASSLTARRVLLADTGTADCDDIARMIGDIAGFSVEVVALDRLAESVRHQLPAAVVFEMNDLTTREIDVIEELRASFDHLPLIVISNALVPSQVRNMLRLAVQDWLVKPLARADLVDTLMRDFHRKSRTVSRVHAVVSAVAGAGATTVALSLADVIARTLDDPQESVALVDLDFSLGACGYLLNMPNGFLLDSVIMDPRRIDVELIKLIQQRHSRGFYVYSFANRDLVTHVNFYELVMRFLEDISAQHEHTIIDIPYHETEWRRDVLTAVDSITIVAEMNLPAIKHALDLVKTISGLKRTSGTVRVLLNKDQTSLFNGHRIDPATLKDLFGSTPFDFLPNDTAVITEAMDRGLLPAEVSASSRFVHAVQRYWQDNLRVVLRPKDG